MGFFSLSRQRSEEQSSSGPSSRAASDELSASEQGNSLIQLPPEILHQILSYLECPQLVSLARTCKHLRNLAANDLLWADLLQPHIPAHDYPETPFPSQTYRDLYITHHPYWFLPRHKIWISDEPHVGKIMLCKYDPRRGCIEGYRLLAERGPAYGLQWSYKPSVVIHSFSPRVFLYLDDPVLKLPHEGVPFQTKQGWWEGEIKMSVGRPGHNTHASFFLSKDIPQHLQVKSMRLWPPTTIPNMPRVRNESQDQFRGRSHKPQTYDDISQTTFRMRHWSQFRTGLSHFGVRIGEETTTWSTLDPKLYTPTKEKPFQGIYVGDYATHGCEFLLVTQTTRAPPMPERRETTSYFQALLNVMADEDDDFFENEQQTAQDGSTVELEDDDTIYQGAIEAIKLTGDPHVPRGEHTWIADDIGPAGLIRVAQEPPFKGARVVRARGHVASRGFVNDEFIPSQLLMINHNKLAQYWVPFGHISFYERIDIDSILNGAAEVSTENRRI